MKRILVIEDLPEMFEMLRYTIAMRMQPQASHLELIHASSGEEAIRLFDTEPDAKVDGLLVGRYNPEDDGLRIISMYRIRHPEARIALFSGEMERSYLNEAVRCGANVHISKPVDFAKLQAFLLQILYKNALEKFPANITTV